MEDKKVKIKKINKDIDNVSARRSNQDDYMVSNEIEAESIIISSTSDDFGDEGKNYPKNKNFLLKSLIFIFLLVVFLGLGINYFFGSERVESIDIPNLKTGASSITIDGDQVLVQLNKLLILPSDAKPITVAAVTDAKKLIADQPDFFADVKNGDWLIVYPDFAIIYDYPANKIVRVGPVQNAPLSNEKK